MNDSRSPDAIASLLFATVLAHENLAAIRATEAIRCGIDSAEYKRACADVERQRGHIKNDLDLLVSLAAPDK